jgi:hypothetical protein
MDKTYLLCQHILVNRERSSDYSSKKEGPVQKRYQVLIPDWLEEYIKWGVKKYKLSFSELIRLEICQAVIGYIAERYPEYKIGFSMKKFLEGVRSYEKGEMKRKDLDKTISQIYFEARKAIEYRFSKEKSSK